MTERRYAHGGANNTVQRVSRVQMSGNSNLVIGSLRIEKVNLPAEWRTTGPVFQDEVIEDRIAFAFIEALVDQHGHNDILEFFELGPLALFDCPTDEPEQRHPSDIVPIGPPRLPIGIA